MLMLPNKSTQIYKMSIMIKEYSKENSIILKRLTFYLRKKQLKKIKKKEKRNRDHK